MNTEPEEDLFERIYDIVFDHFRSYRREELESLELYKKAPEDDDDLYEPFQYATDRIIKAKARGEHNAIKMRNNSKAELELGEPITSTNHLQRKFETW